MTASREARGKGYTLLRTIEGETLVIPAVRIRFVMWFLSIWFVLWTAVGITSLMTTESFNPDALSVFGILMWIFGWVCAGSLLLWMFTGRELISFRSGNLEVRRSAFGLSRKLVYHGPSIRDLRVEPRPWFGTPRGGAYPFFGNSRFGAIRFSYRGWAQDLALGVGEDEAREIHDWLRNRLTPGEGGGHRAHHDL